MYKLIQIETKSMDQVLFDNDMLSLISQHLNYHDVIRLMSVNKELNSIMLPIQEKKLTSVLNQSSEALIILRSSICFNPSENKSINVCIQEMRERKLNAFRNLIVNNWYVFHISGLYTTAFISLLIDRTSWFHDLFYTQKWYKYPEFRHLSKHIQIHNPEHYSKNDRALLYKALNIPKKSKASSSLLKKK
jgi:hypothetical protein